MAKNGTEIFNWFAAAYLHDLGKANINPQGVWQNHKKLQGGPFESLLPPDMIALIAKHHDPIDFDSGTQRQEEMALIMADRFQKGMHGAEDLERDKRLDPLKKYPAFYPYYGTVEDGWDQGKAAGLILGIRQVLNKGINLPNLMELDERTARFPPTTYFPHLSLSLHHRFSALLLYFLIKRSNQSRKMNELGFSAVTVTPEAIPLFYRLRDVESHTRAVDFLREQVFRKVFVEDRKNLPDLKPKCNPFEFFDKGHTLVFVYDEPKRIISALQEILDEREYLRALMVELTEFHLEAKQDDKGFLGVLSPGYPRISAWSLLSKKTLDYPATSLERCWGCGKPQQTIEFDIKGDALCPACLGERKTREEKREVVDIHEVSFTAKGEEGQVAYVFLALQEPLSEKAIAVAKGFLSRLADQRRVKPDILRPSKGGLFEYLQAIMDIEAFQNKVDDVIVELRKKKPLAYTLIRFPTLMTYLMTEEHYWDFLAFLNEERKKLQLASSLRAILCPPKTPFWSLMDQFTTYDEHDYYYDAAGGTIVMFTNEEVAEIRKLATIAQREWRSSAQLMALSRFAANRNLEELLLELDVRTGQGKLSRSLPKPLTEALRKMPGDEPKAQTKRAKFIDYIAKLARSQSQSGERR